MCKGDQAKVANQSGATSASLPFAGAADVRAREMGPGKPGQAPGKPSLEEEKKTRIVSTTGDRGGLLPRRLCHPHHPSSEMLSACFIQTASWQRQGALLNCET